MQTIKTECLDRFVVLGEAHLRHIVREFLAYYHEERPHQARENLPLGQSSAGDGGATPVRGLWSAVGDWAGR